MTGIAVPPPCADRAAPTARLFIALWPPPRVRQALAACRDATAWPAGAAPTASDKLHLTLHFIGSVAAGRVDAIAAALQVPVQGFDLQLDLVERWRGGLAVLRPRQPPPRLLQLHAELAGVLQRLGLPVEPRGFRPHVTLARRAAAAAPVAPAAPLHWRASGYALVQSGPDGRYRVLQRYR
ncbi:MAG: RNA 2',3'-cyclic phosphodiesterase [Burkholderiaceae bacterium]|nr:RNA 2',3'-cyclic phosphodiesterase [Burkholderiaceae bacterium]